MKTFTYIAYGSNMNHYQMRYRCPKARFLGLGMLKGYTLEFRSVADVIPSTEPSDFVPVAIWEITEDCLEALDFYEGYPNLYGRETVTVQDVGGSDVEGICYYMNRKGFAPPVHSYYTGIMEGYRDCGAMPWVFKLKEARSRAIGEAMGLVC